MTGNQIALVIIGILAILQGIIIGIKIKSSGLRLISIAMGSVANASIVYFVFARIFDPDNLEYVAWSGIFIFIFSIYACIVTSLALVVVNALHKTKK